jgi:hypothetical protein
MVGEYFPWAFHVKHPASASSCDTDSDASCIMRSVSGASSMSTGSGDGQGDPSTPTSHFIYTQVSRTVAVTGNRRGLLCGEATARCCGCFWLRFRSSRTTHADAQHASKCCPRLSRRLCLLGSPPSVAYLLAGQPQVSSRHRRIRQAARRAAALPDDGADAAVAANAQQRSA